MIWISYIDLISLIPCSSLLLLPLMAFPRLKEGCSKTAPETTEAVHWALVTRNQEYLLVNFENYDILLIWYGISLSIRILYISDLIILWLWHRCGIVLWLWYTMIMMIVNIHDTMATMDGCEILRQLMVNIPYYLQAFNHPFGSAGLQENSGISMIWLWWY